MLDKKLNLLQVNQLLKLKQDEMNILIKNKSKFSGRAFVVFHSVDDCNKVFNFEKQPFRKFWRITKSICNQMDRIYPVRADDPKDIIWENMALSDCWKLARRILTIIVSLVMIVMNFFVCYFINTVKSNMQSAIRA